MLVRDGRIVAVGQGRRVENLADARSAAEIDATGRVVLPGFVDSHTHLVPVDAEAMSSRALARQAEGRIRMFVRHGTTTLEAKAGQIKTLRVLARLDSFLISLVPTYLGGLVHAAPGEELAEMIFAVARHRLARFADVNCGRHGLGVDDARHALETARQAGLGLKVHAEQHSPSVGVRLAVECGATSAANLEAAEEDDIAILAESSTVATLLPGRTFYLGLDHHAPARALIDRGVAVALATGFHPATSPTCSMQMVMSLACTQLAMTPAEAIAAATINGAHALGMADQTGSLEAGKLADFTLFDVSDYREIPCQFGVNLAVLTVKGGVVIYRQGETP